MADHDSLYHRLFDHPDIVAELLREFLPDAAVEGPDLDGMTRENAKFHAVTGDRRDGDMIWRIPRRDGGETYLLLLLEFQSTSDRWMAGRIAGRRAGSGAEHGGERWTEGPPRR